jgi:hypothetical protein
MATADSAAPFVQIIEASVIAPGDIGGEVDPIGVMEKFREFSADYALLKVSWSAAPPAPPPPQPPSPLSTLLLICRHYCRFVAGCLEVSSASISCQSPAVCTHLHRIPSATLSCDTCNFEETRGGGIVCARLNSCLTSQFTPNSKSHPPSFTHQNRILCCRACVVFTGCLYCRRAC